MSTQIIFQAIKTYSEKTQHYHKFSTLISKIKIQGATFYCIPTSAEEILTV